MLDQITLWHVIAIVGVYALFQIANAIHRFCELVEEIIDSEPLPDESRTNDRVHDPSLASDGTPEEISTEASGIHPIRRDKAA